MSIVESQLLSTLFRIIRGLSLRNKEPFPLADETGILATIAVFCFHLVAKLGIGNRVGFQSFLCGNHAGSVSGFGNSSRKPESLIMAAEILGRFIAPFCLEQKVAGFGRNIEHGQPDLFCAIRPEQNLEELAIVVFFHIECKRNAGVANRKRRCEAVPCDTHGRAGRGDYHSSVIFLRG